MLQQLNTSLDEVDPAWAWQPLESAGPSVWGLESAAHLFRRAAFGANWRGLSAAVEAGCQATLDRLLADQPSSETFYAGADVSADTLTASASGENLPAWWLHVMLHTPHPLLEKMTLFWHGHFATSAEKVNDPKLMLAQNRLLRQHALGQFGPLLRGIARDPAMLLWLDSATNRKSHPNENFAREVMELFTLGLGHYTERDVKEAARAFTGWEIRHGKFRINAYQHDTDEKTVLGRSGRWDGDDVLDILLEQPATARFLVRKLFRYFVSETAEPSDALLAPLADGLAACDFDLAWLLRTMLGSNLFYSPHAVRQKVKAPVEFAIALLKALEGTANMYALADDLGQLGQAVFFPPNVKGWDGGTNWINSATLVTRANLVWGLVGGESRYKSKVELQRLAALEGLAEPATIARRLVDLLLACPLPDEVRVQLAAVAAGDGQGAPGGDQRLRLARLVQAVATLPEFQLA